MEKISLFVLEFILLAIAIFCFFVTSKYPQAGIGTIICVFICELLITLQMLKVL